MPPVLLEVAETLLAAAAVFVVSVLFVGVVIVSPPVGTLSNDAVSDVWLPAADEGEALGLASPDPVSDAKAEPEAYPDEP